MSTTNRNAGRIPLGPPPIFVANAPRKRKTHWLKIDPVPFAAVAKGEKRAEFRKDDRDFSKDDYVVLCEYKLQRYTGRKLDCCITHIQKGYGIPDGFAMLSVQLLRVS